ncbi:putative short chain dehydrogenase/reductase [Auricularia subglabra TFB-10046 SS5]|nr:putative short chain dehydrogenase/reductase [Auricularia subglabra TFB-10046 SS5]
MVGSVLAASKSLLTLLGAIYAVPLTYRFLRFLHVYLRPSSLHEYRCDNAWALVTGATEGLGCGFAFELAARGFNVVIHGRRADKLQRRQAALEAAFPGIHVRTLCLDASLYPDTAAVLRCVTALPGPLTVLVNNVGGAQMQARPFSTFAELSTHEVDAVTNVNVNFPMYLTHALLPVLSPTLETRALVLNVLGHAAPFPMPYMSVYGAGKGHSMVLTKSLAREMAFEKRRVEVLGIHVGKVTDTALFKDAGSLFVPCSRNFARQSLDRVGCGRLAVCGHWAHAVQMWLLECLPEGLQGRVLGEAILGEMKAGEAKDKKDS